MQRRSFLKFLASLPVVGPLLASPVEAIPPALPPTVTDKSYVGVYFPPCRAIVMASGMILAKDYVEIGPNGTIKKAKVIKDSIGIAICSANDGELVNVMFNGSPGDWHG